MTDAASAVKKELVAKYGEGQKPRIEKGVGQVASFWREEDGGREDFTSFIILNFAGTPEKLHVLFNRFEYLLERMDGHMTELVREFKLQAELDLGPIMPYDEVFAGYNPSAHINDDFFANKLAFTVLLNFPLKTLDEKIAEGEKWSRRQWAEVRLAERFAKRIPAGVLLEYSKAAAESDQYIADYNIFMGHVFSEDGRKLFPKDMRLLSHWNLRDEIKADYQDAKDGLAKQRTIEKVMQRIVDQSIPKVVINNPNYDWNPFSNTVERASEQNADYSIAPPGSSLQSPEPDTRYEVWRKSFLAVKLIDPYSSTAPTHIQRRFDEDRELPEPRVKKIFEDVLRSPLAANIASLIEKRLGRNIEPFDIWYNGFKPRGTHSQEHLDAIVKKRYPTTEAFQKDMPQLLMKLGFSKLRAEFLASKITIDPARGSGHAMGAGMRDANARLRTRVGKDGMDYKGFNIAVHELGHNVEQVFSLNSIDHTLLQGVPNTAFTEALAFVFQAQDMKLLGLAAEDEEAQALKTLNDYWMTYEIAGVALVDMEAWHWLYDHPAATPRQFRDAVLDISKHIWNEYYAPVFKQKDVILLGIYSHLVHSFLYLPDYPLGHLIAFQIEEVIRNAGSIGPECERVATFGRLSPDLWMKMAGGHTVGAESLLDAAADALTRIEKMH
jgi:hypothetical protein